MILYLAESFDSSTFIKNVIDKESKRVVLLTQSRRLHNALYPNFTSVFKNVNDKYRQLSQNADSAFFDWYEKYADSKHLVLIDYYDEELMGRLDYALFHNAELAADAYIIGHPNENVNSYITSYNAKLNHISTMIPDKTLVFNTMVKIEEILHMEEDDDFVWYSIAQTKLSQAVAQDESARNSQIKLNELLMEVSDGTDKVEQKEIDDEGSSFGSGQEESE